MIPHIGFTALSLWVLTMLHDVVDCTGTDIPETVILVKDDEPHNITSEGFPGCCTPMKYLIKQAVDNKRDSEYWKLLFTDVDIPPFSQLMIYGVKGNGSEDSKKIPISAAQYLHGVWIRPVVLFQGDALIIEFLPQQNLLKKADNVEMYTGFKAVYWLDNKAWQLDKPFTVCPPIDDAIEGGRVTVDSVQIILDPQHYRMYCVWQLKPVPQSDLQIYITLENLSGSDSSVKVHDGLTSVSPVIFSASSIESPRTFTSKDGFYIELSKPTDQDSFSMAYGVYKTLLRTEQCVFQVDGKSVEGFRCEEVEEDYCIPKENVCDKIQNCPSGSDENSETCYKPKTLVITTTSIPSTIHEYDDFCPRGRCRDGQCPRHDNEQCPEKDCGLFKRRCTGTLLCVLTNLETCPGEPCASFQKTCRDGSCLQSYQQCSGECSLKEKRCRDGSCMSIDQRCPGEPCSRYKPIECDGECHYERIQCDGLRRCSDGSDEADCGIIRGKKREVLQVIIPILIVIILIAVVCFIRRNRLQSRNARSPSEMRASEETGWMNRTPTDSAVPQTFGFSSNNEPPPMTGISNASYTPWTPHNSTSDTEPRFTPSGPESQPSPPVSDTAAPADPPPSYKDVMNNQDVYVAPSEPPPSYSSVFKEQA